MMLRKGSGAPYRAYGNRGTGLTLDVALVGLAGTPAWFAELHLDQTAHPGETQLRQRFRLVPMRDGLLVLSFKGTDAGFGAQAAVIGAIAAGVTLRP